MATHDQRRSRAPVASRKSVIRHLDLNRPTRRMAFEFGAFGVEANARSLWTSLEKKYPALAARQPSYVKAGTITRLQAGGFEADLAFHTSVAQ
mgnify:CR=1 FL=1